MRALGVQPPTRLTRAGLVILLAVIAAGGSVQSASGFAPQRDASARRTEWTAAEACRAVIPDLERRLQALDRREVTYSYRLYAARESEAPSFEIPTDAESPDRLYSVVIATVKRCGSGYRIEERTVWARDTESQGRLLTFTSDGVEFHTRFGWAQSAIGNLMLDLTDSVQRVSPQMDAYGWRVLGEVAPFDYPYYMRHGAESNDATWSAIDDSRGTVSWRWLPDVAKTRITATIDRKRATLEGIARVICDHDADRADAKVMLRSAIRFQDHVVQGERLRGSRLETQLAEGGPAFPPTWSVAVVEPIAVRPVDCSTDWMHLQPVEGEIVQDARFDIAYHAGGTTVNLDGRIIEPRAPASGDVGWRLGEMVREPSPVPATVGGASAPTPASGDEPGVVVFDAGDFEIAGDPVRVSHTFVVQNDSTERWEVDQVVPSCGCLTCEMSVMAIDPGQSGSLAVEMVMPNPGVREQRVAVVLKHGEILQFVVRARGHSIGSVRAMTSGLVRHGDALSTEVRVYWVDSDPALRVAEPAAPVLTGPDGSVLHFDGWELVEPASEDGLRPRRLVGRGRIEVPVASVAEPEREVALKIVCGHKRERSMTLEVRSEASSARK